MLEDDSPVVMEIEERICGYLDYLKNLDQNQQGQEQDSSNSLKEDEEEEIVISDPDFDVDVEEQESVKVEEGQSLSPRYDPDH